MINYTILISKIKMATISSQLQTKKWRMSQPWWKGGKRLNVKYTKDLL